MRQAVESIWVRSVPTAPSPLREGSGNTECLDDDDIRRGKRDQRGEARDAQCDIGAFEFTVVVDQIFSDRFEVETF
jgi:hypothetical protein